jgi:hypothetical protein
MLIKGILGLYKMIQREIMKGLKKLKETDDDDRGGRVGQYPYPL